MEDFEMGMMAKLVVLKAHQHRKKIVIALMGATLESVFRDMVPAVVLASERMALPAPTFYPLRKRLTWSNGTTATLFSAESPDLIRGHQFHFAWVHGCAGSGLESLNNLRRGLLLGGSPFLVQSDKHYGRRCADDVCSACGFDLDTGYECPSCGHDALNERKD